MSYDITLLPRRPGQDWDDVLRRPPADGRDRQQLLAVWDRVEARLRDALPGQVEVWRSAPDTDTPTIAELTVMETGLQVGLYAGTASVSFPYWEQDDPESFHRTVTTAVRVVAEETGYAAFDPQTDAPFDGTFDDERGIEFTRGLSHGSGGAIFAVPDPGASATSGPAGSAAPAQGSGFGQIPTEERRPFYSGRRRAGTYLVVGIVVTIGALLLLAAGRTGTVTWIALAIGVADLLVGAALWSSLRDKEKG